MAPSLPADYYRTNAARVRTLATAAMMPAIKEHLLEVAGQYDALAEQASEAIHRAGR